MTHTRKPTSFELAVRLLNAMNAGYAVKRGIIYLVSPENEICMNTSWTRKTDMLRGNGRRGGLLGLGTAWRLDENVSLPQGISNEITDEELDLKLSVMGY